MDSHRIVLADDHLVVRAGLRELILTFNEYHVVGEAGDGLEAIALAATLQPNIMILDLAMPKMRGVEAIREIKRVAPECKILILSMHDREEYVRQSLKNGAHGYILKESAADELQLALKYLQRDEMYLSPGVAKLIVGEWLDASHIKPNRLPHGSNLTAREIDVLKLISEGYTSKEAADLLHISNKTVDTHRFRLMEKLEINNLAGLIKYALKMGLTDI